MTVGDRVRYWKGAKRGEPSGEGAIRMEGVMGGADVVWISGCSGCVAVSHVELVDDPQGIVAQLGMEVAKRYPPGTSGLPPKPAPEPRRRRYEVVGMFTPLEASLGWADTWLVARAILRGAIRMGAYADYWIVDHWCGGRIWDLNGSRRRK
jgi:hypothetical protein